MAYDLGHDRPRGADRALRRRRARRSHAPPPASRCCASRGARGDGAVRRRVVVRLCRGHASRRRVLPAAPPVPLIRADRGRSRSSRTIPAACRSPTATCLIYTRAGAPAGRAAAAAAGTADAPPGAAATAQRRAAGAIPAAGAGVAAMPPPPAPSSPVANPPQPRRLRPGVTGRGAAAACWPKHRAGRGTRRSEPARLATAGAASGGNRARPRNCGVPLSDLRRTAAAPSRPASSSADDAAHRPRAATAGALIASLPGSLRRSIFGKRAERLFDAGRMRAALRRSCILAQGVACR